MKRVAFLFFILLFFSQAKERLVHEAFVVQEFGTPLLAETLQISQLQTAPPSQGLAPGPGGIAPPSQGLAPGPGGMGPVQMIRPQPPQQIRPLPYFPTPLAPRTPLAPFTPQARSPMLYSTPTPDRPISQPQGPQRHLPREPLYNELYWPNMRGRYLPQQRYESLNWPAENQQYSGLPRPSGAFHPPAPPLPQSQAQMQFQHQLPYENPVQGYIPRTYYGHQRTPMETEHHDLFMSNPQPLVNPPGPNPNEVPGDYSTLPGL
jgi:hypothetical protein